jgi:hypothetical protein
MSAIPSKAIEAHAIEGAKGTTPAAAGSLKYLQAALVMVGIIFIAGIYLLTIIWPSGWAWHAHGQSNYLQMILGVYATLGVFLLRASRNALENLSLIWFTVWSSVVHAAIMAVQSLVNPEHIGHLWGDVPALLIVAGLLAVLTPRRVATQQLVTATARSSTSYSA